MSTRSGRRIHGSIHENVNIPDAELVAKSEKKTRSRRVKENDGVVVHKNKKRNNYVSYPSEDDVGDGTILSNVETDDKKALKEQDLNVSAKTVDEVDTGKIARQTRRTKKISESVTEDAPPPSVAESGKSKKRSKKNKKKELEHTEANENENPVIVPKKSKKKKGKKVNAFTEERITPEVGGLNKSTGSVDSFHSAADSPVKESKSVGVVTANSSLVKSPRRAAKRMKADSCEDIDGADLDDIPNRSSKKIKLSHSEKSLEVNNRSLRSKDVKNSDKEKDATFDKSSIALEALNGTFETSQRKSIKNSTFDKVETNTPVKKFNSTFDKNNTPTPKNNIKAAEVNSNTKRKSRSNLVNTPDKIRLNSTYEKNSSEPTLNGTFENSNKTRQSVQNTTFEKANDSKQTTLNSTFDKNRDAQQSTGNSTFDKSKDSASSTLNSTFDKNKKARQSLNSTFEKVKDSTQTRLNSTFEKSTESKQSNLNSTFEKSEPDSTGPTLNSTFDKESKLNSTYDKNENNSESSKSSLISSDSASNVTLDKSDENSRISITSDDSRMENIVNTTPVLIESSMDESQIAEPTPEKAEEAAKLQPSATPLKREGTFTKDGPDVVIATKPVVTKTATPVKRMSLPSPGSTPFPFSKSAQKEKSMLNVTRSIEKAIRRSSLAEPAQRMTKVMFCSPVNNPVVAMQQKKKIIKSSMKGSNKSFIFDESASDPVRAAGRKRSHTASAADEARARTKRSRLEPRPPARPRLRTASATVKPSEPSTPLKKPFTPLKKVASPAGKAEAKPARTKLPNFAALHQKEFAKMESLDECQERRARRARQLLTPTGAAGDRSSPRAARVTTSEVLKAVAAKEPAKKTDTPTKTPKLPKLPTLMSLRPGYTRFGFKMHAEDNPFSVPSKTQPKAETKIEPKIEIKPRETKPNGLTRQPSQPSLAGATATRREVAKQTVMREKSFTSLSERRNVTRTENRSVIKGVRTNRRFELQMKMRNINS